MGGIVIIPGELPQPGQPYIPGTDAARDQQVREQRERAIAQATSSMATEVQKCAPTVAKKLAELGLGGTGLSDARQKNINDVLQGQNLTLTTQPWSFALMQPADIQKSRYACQTRDPRLGGAQVEFLFDANFKLLYAWVWKPDMTKTMVDFTQEQQTYTRDSFLEPAKRPSRRR
jgi:hypothetical protein